MPDNIEMREIEPMPSQQVDPLLFGLIVGALAIALLLVVHWRAGSVGTWHRD